MTYSDTGCGYPDGITTKVIQEVTMRSNRIQFQPGMSLTQFLDEYGTEEQCEDALE